MSGIKKLEKRTAQSWAQFVERFCLNETQEKQFKTYAELLQERNNDFNLTAITDTPGIIRHHFSDSLELANWRDMTAVSGLCDAGCGAGFPALPLKIMYPHIRMVLIEVNQKKQRFLREVITELSLTDVEVAPHDWRTFLRTTTGDIPLFIARASLSVPELCRMFRATCSYNTAELIYWASEKWEPEKAIQKHIRAEHRYKLGVRSRRLVLLTI